MIPEGWKLVPEFPSIEMIKAGAASIDDNGGNARWADIREAWADMLDAAPTPPAQQEDEVLEVLRRIVDVWGSPWPPGADPMQDVMRDACALLEKRGAA